MMHRSFSPEYEDDEPGENWLADSPDAVLRAVERAPDYPHMDDDLDRQREASPDVEQDDHLMRVCLRAENLSE